MVLWDISDRKMPADMMEKTSSSPVAATPASMNTTPDKPKTASEHRKVCMKLVLQGVSPSSINRKTEKFKEVHFYAPRHLTVHVIFVLSLVIQANHGKEEKSQNQ